jgi:hypothetical protein
MNLTISNILLPGLVLSPLAISFLFSTKLLQQLYTGGLLLINGILLIGITGSHADDFNSYIFLLFSNIAILIITLIVYIVDKDSNAERCIEANNFDGNKRRRINERSALLMSLMANIFFLIAVGGTEGLLKTWIDVAGELENNSYFRTLSMLSYTIALAHIIGAREYGANIINIIAPVSLLIVFSVAMRVKLFIIPVVFVLFLSGHFKKLPYWTIFWSGLISVVAYMLIMFARWYGSVDGVSSEHLIDVYSSVTDAGFERELYHQFDAVMKYYENNSPNCGWALQRIIFLPIDWIFSTGFSPENPMYEYYAIYTGVTGSGGSAHPTIYADSYAEYGVLGVFVPAVYYYLVSMVNKLNKRGIFGNVIMAASLISMPLLIRGSVFYAISYFCVSIVIAAIVSSLFNLIGLRVMTKKDV